MTYDDANNIIQFYTVDDEGLEWNLYFMTDSPIIINTDGKIMATDTEGDPVILTFYKSVPIDFLAE